ncbi:MAG TPA: DNA repair protein RecO [Candidatus Saccharimonadales bacterium]|nr:DNA repair protein RecO [Candidatus Saccharimonadales bacterium]
MAYYQTVGIVLRRTNLGEADRIITFLAPELGKVRAVARGVRRIKSRLAGHLELFGEVDLMLAEGRSLDVITSARLQRPAEAMASDYGRLAAGYMLAEMLDRLVGEGAAGRELYESTRAGYLDLINQGASQLLELWFKLRLASALGYRPQLNRCTLCQGQPASQAYFFSSEAGGIVDGSCASSRRHPMTPNQIKLWRLLLVAPLERVRRLEGAAEAAAASLGTCDAFYDYTFGRRFTSSQLLGSEAA